MTTVNLEQEANDARALGDACIARAAESTELGIKAINAADAARHYALAQKLNELAFREWVEATAEALVKLDAPQIELNQEVWQEALDAGMNPEEAAQHILDQASTHPESGR